jgi:ABC-2 type transport system ATP-binding protein
MESDQMTAVDAAIRIQGLKKTYGAAGKGQAKQALNGVDLTVPKGSIFALLGPNGAGKSTLINILAGLVNKTDGKVEIWGTDIDADPRQARANIGVVPQELNIDPFFSPREMLELQSGLYGVPKTERRTDELLAAVGLADKADAYARTLSGGMKRRLMVAKAMVHTPPVLVLDEPTAGVDVELRHMLWDYVRDLNRRGATVLLTTHYLEEAEDLCDTIAIISRGDLVACEPKETLLARLDSKTLRLTVDRDLTELPPGLAALGATLDGPRRVVTHYQPSRLGVGAILAAVADAGLSVADLSTEEADLEDIFIRLTSSNAGSS